MSAAAGLSAPFWACVVAILVAIYPAASSEYSLSPTVPTPSQFTGCEERFLQALEVVPVSARDSLLLTFDLSFAAPQAGGVVSRTVVASRNPLFLAMSARETALARVLSLGFFDLRPAHIHLTVNLTAVEWASVGAVCAMSPRTLSHVALVLSARVNAALHVACDVSRTVCVTSDPALAGSARSVWMVWASGIGLGLVAGWFLSFAWFAAVELLAGAFGGLTPEEERGGALRAVGAGWKARVGIRILPLVLPVAILSLRGGGLYPTLWAGCALLASVASGATSFEPRGTMASAGKWLIVCGVAAGGIGAPWALFGVLLRPLESVLAAVFVALVSAYIVLAVRTVVALGFDSSVFYTRADLAVEELVRRTGRGWEYAWPHTAIAKFKSRAFLRWYESREPERIFDDPAEFARIHEHAGRTENGSLHGTQSAAVVTDDTTGELRMLACMVLMFLQHERFLLGETPAQLRIDNTFVRADFRWLDPANGFQLRRRLVTALARANRVYFARLLAGVGLPLLELCALLVVALVADRGDALLFVVVGVWRLRVLIHAPVRIGPTVRAHDAVLTAVEGVRHELALGIDPRTRILLDETEPNRLYTPWEAMMLSNGPAATGGEMTTVAHASGRQTAVPTCWKNHRDARCRPATRRWGTEPHASGRSLMLSELWRAELAEEFIDAFNDGKASEQVVDITVTKKDVEMFNQVNGTSLELDGRTLRKQTA